MNLLPIQPTIEENQAFTDNLDCLQNLPMTIDYFNRIGYNPPWIGYYVEKEGEIVGSAAYKGKPKDGAVEIAYGVFTQHQNKGIGTEICRDLVNLALETDPTVHIIARTLPEENFSVHILKKNNFKLAGMVYDEEDGDVWEWVYEK